MRNSNIASDRYSNRTVWIHWVSTLLIFGLIYTGINMEHGAHDLYKFDLYKSHFALGSAVFLLTIWRLIALFKDLRPKPLYPDKSLHQRFIQFVQYGFYLVLIWMCISGICSLFLEGISSALLNNDFELLPEIAMDGFHPIMMSHHIIAKVVFLLLIFHIGGFIIHLIRKKKNSLKRIWLD